MSIASELFLNLEQAERAVVVCLQADLPVALWGDYGIGKSAVVEGIAKAAQFELVESMLSTMERSDFGLPYPEDGKVKYLVPQWLPFEENVGDSRVLWFLDEYDRAPLEVQNATLQLILARRLNGHKLGANVRIVLAGNAGTDLGTTPLSGAAVNRVVHLYVSAEARGGREAWAAWAQKAGVNDAVIALSEHRPRLWSGAAGRLGDSRGGVGSNMGEGLTEMGEARPRSMVHAGKVLDAIEGMKFPCKDLVLPLLSGCVGHTAAIELLSFQRLRQQAPSIEEILRDPHKARVPDSPDVMTALGDRVLEEVKVMRESMPDPNDPNANYIHAKELRVDIDKLLQYVMRWPSEQAAKVMGEAAKQLPFSEYPAMKAWIQELENKKKSEGAGAGQGAEFPVALTGDPATLYSSVGGLTGADMTKAPLTYWSVKATLPRDAEPCGDRMTRCWRAAGIIDKNGIWTDGITPWGPLLGETMPRMYEIYAAKAGSITDALDIEQKVIDALALYGIEPRQLYRTTNAKGDIRGVIIPEEWFIK